MEKALREDLEKLRRELHEGPELDAETRETLAGLAQEIEEAIERSGGREDTLSERLRTATERFEESHPSLTAVVGRLADMLSGVGI
jgi:metal-dependent amidase/aminoacylase/carboxypeptidase family protein